MLKDSLYILTSFDHKDNIISSNLELNSNAPIFSGHFPGQPVLPGACMLQIVKEISEKAFKRPVRLKIANQMKFLKVLDPTVNTTMDLNIIYSVDKSSILINANMTAAGEVAFKLKGVFTFSEQ